MLLIRHGHVKPIEGPDFIGDVLVDAGKIVALGEHIDALVNSYGCSKF